MNGVSPSNPPSQSRRPPGLGMSATLARSRGGITLVVLGLGMLAFEIFNYSSTQAALEPLIGQLRVFGIGWDYLIAIAFCAVDLAGLARMFTPNTEVADEPAEVWYLFGAWLLASVMNATLTWWGMKITIATSAQLPGADVIDPGFVKNVLPVLFAVIVWLVRILLIGSFSATGDRVLHERSRSFVRENMLPTRTQPQPQSRYTQPAPTVNRPSNQDRPVPTYQNHQNTRGQR